MQASSLVISLTNTKLLCLIAVEVSKAVLISVLTSTVTEDEKFPDESWSVSHTLTCTVARH